jgi:uncharacterized integral membrane protein
MYGRAVLDPGSSSGGSRWRVWAAVAAIILVAIFILQNSQEVNVEFFFATIEAPLIFALLFAALLGFAGGALMPRGRRSHKQDD